MCFAFMGLSERRPSAWHPSGGLPRFIPSAPWAQKAMGCKGHRDSLLSIGHFQFAVSLEPIQSRTAIRFTKDTHPAPRRAETHLENTCVVRRIREAQLPSSWQSYRYYCQKCFEGRTADRR